MPSKHNDKRLEQRRHEEQGPTLARSRKFLNDIAVQIDYEQPFRKCTICPAILGTSQMSVNNHLIGHVRKNELSEADKWKVRRDIMSRLERA